MELLSLCRLLVIHISDIKIILSKIEEGIHIMGGSLNPIVSNNFMNHFEINALNLANIKPKVYNVDDALSSRNIEFVPLFTFLHTSTRYTTK